MFAFRILHTVPYSNEPAASDVIAKLHSFVTSNLLVAASLVISFRQFGGKPIDCMVPPDFTSSWAQYAETYCWAQETYYVPFSNVVAGLSDDDKAEKRVSYYQWMPFFLLFGAACFKVPCLIWKYFASQSGLRIGEILRLASSDSNGVPEVKKSNVEALGVHLNGALRFHKMLSHRKLIPHKFVRLLNVKYSTYYVTLIYFIAKAGFLINVGLQIRLLENYVLPRSEDEHLAFKTWNVLVRGNETWKENGMFPRVTLCDFETRDMGNVQNHTIQCLLLMNVFTEKVFLVLWTWYMALAAFTAMNIVSWSWSMMSDTSQMHFILSHIEMSDISFDKNRSEEAEAVARFVNLYLGSDGMLVLFLVSQHSDILFTTELIAHLWKSFVDVEQQRLALKRMNEFVELRHKVELSNAADEKDGLAMKPLKRTMSMEGIEPTKKFDDSSSDESSKASETRKRKGKGSKESTPSTAHPSPVKRSIVHK